MKVIFDFDDVIFDTKLFKKHIFSSLTQFNIDEDVVKEFYEKNRKAFNLSSLLKEIVISSGVSVSDEELEDIVDMLLQDAVKYVDTKLIDLMKKIGLENCFIITAGEVEFQKQKLKISGVTDLLPLGHIMIVGYDKKKKIKFICKTYQNERVIFVDDKEDHIEEAKHLALKNLHTVLYNERGFEVLSKSVDFLQEQ